MKAMALSLSLLLMIPSPAAAAKTVQEKVKGWKLGSTVVVKLVDDQKITGKLASVAADGIRLTVKNNQDQTDRTIPFDQIKSVKKPMSNAMAITIVAVVGGLVAGAIIGSQIVSSI